MPRSQHLTDLRNKWVLVTGAASGIGFATAKAFARRKAKLIITDINETALNAAALELSASGVTCVAQFCDVSSVASVAACAAAVQAQTPALDVLVNNAGIAFMGGFLETSVEQWQRTLQVNVMGPVHMTRAFLPAMQAAKGARHVVNVASMATYTPAPNMSAYAASKGAVKLFNETLALELAGSNVLVQGVYPGVINTPIVGGIRSVGANISPQQLEQLQRHYAHKGCSPDVVGEDIAIGVLKGKAHIFSGPQSILGRVASALSNRLTRAVTLQAARRIGYLPNA